MVLERSLADRSMLTAGGVQFVVGCMLEGEQGIVGTGYGQEDLVELVLRRPLMAGLGVLAEPVTRNALVLAILGHLSALRRDDPGARRLLDQSQALLRAL